MLIPSDRPAYRIMSTHGFYGPDDHLYAEGECIVFDDEPNEEMEPLNEPARARMASYIKKLDDGARRVAEKNGREYLGRPTSFDAAIAQARSDEQRRIELVKGDGGVPLMGGARKTESIQKLGDEDVPEVGTHNPKRRGRPPKSSLSLPA